MIFQRLINLNPAPDRLEVFKITYPPHNSRRSDITIKPMRFIPHDGKAKQ